MSDRMNIIASTSDREDRDIEKKLAKATLRNRRWRQNRSIRLQTLKGEVKDPREKTI